MTQNEFDQISLIVNRLFNVIQVEDQFWIVQNFEPASDGGTTGNYSFNSFSGICITEFVKAAKIIHSNKTEEISFLQQLERFLENKVYVKVKFNKSANYFYFTKN